MTRLCSDCIFAVIIGACFNLTDDFATTLLICFVHLFFKYWLRFNGLKFCLKVQESVVAAVWTTPSIGEIVVIVLNFVARAAPYNKLDKNWDVTVITGWWSAYQFPLPPPSFLVLLGSALNGPDFPKKRGTVSWAMEESSERPEWSWSLTLWERVTAKCEKEGRLWAMATLSIYPLRWFTHFLTV